MLPTAVLLLLLLLAAVVDARHDVARAGRLRSCAAAGVPAASGAAGKAYVDRRAADDGRVLLAAADDGFPCILDTAGPGSAAARLRGENATAALGPAGDVQMRAEALPRLGTPPSRRYFASQVYDNERDELVVFGGTGGGDAPLDDTWRFSFASSRWDLVAVIRDQRPPARAEHAAAIVGRFMYIMGGVSADTAGASRVTSFVDVWSFDLDVGEWRRVFDDVSSVGSYRLPTRGTASVAIAAEDSIYLLGGLQTGIALRTDGIAVGRFRPQRRTLTEVENVRGTPPADRVYAAAATIDDTRIALMGGYAFAEDGQATFFDDLWILDVAEPRWTRIETSRPLPVLDSHSMSVVGSEIVIVFGWNDAQDAGSADVWLHNVDSGETAVVPMPASVDIGQRTSLFPALPQRSGIVYAFGGSGDEVYNDLNAFNVSGRAWSVVQTSTTAPTGRSQPAAAATSSHLVLFGGRDEDNVVLRDVWHFDLVRESWSSVEALGTPSGRYAAVAVSDGQRVLVFGGRDQASVFDELWAYDATTTVWRLVDVGDDADKSPAARFDAAAVVHGDLMIVHGGRAASNAVLSDLWVLDLGTMTWTRDEAAPLFATDGILLRAGHVMAVVDDRLVLIGGFGADESLAIAYGLFDLEDATGAAWTVHAVPEESVARAAVQRVGHGLVSFGPFGLLYGGQVFLESLDHDPFLVGALDIPAELDASYVAPTDNGTAAGEANVFQFLQPQDRVTVPPSRAGHTMVLANNRVYVFGGTGYQLGALAPGYSLTDMWTIGLDRPCSAAVDDALCFACTPGTYVADATAGTCATCPAGTYSATFGASACTACPRGFFAPATGGTSRFVCQPCPFGTYADTAGAASCLPCPAGLFCPVASIRGQPTSADTGGGGSGVGASSTQPDQLDTGGEYVAGVVDGLWWTVFALAIGFTILCIAIHRLAPHNRFVSATARGLRAVDIFSRLRSGPDAVRRKGLVGGYVTVLFLATAFYVLVSVFLTHDRNNLIETKYAVPLFAEQDRTIVGDFDTHVTAAGYTGACVVPDTTETCVAGIGVATTGIVVDEADTPSLTCAEFDNSCRVRWICPQCRLTLGDAKVHFQFNMRDVYASAIDFSVRSSTGIETAAGVDDDGSSVQGSLRPAAEDELFMGRRASVVRLAAIPSYFVEYTAGGALVRDGTGYHVDFSSAELGTTVRQEDFLFENGLLVDLAFARSEQVLRTERRELRTLFELLTLTLGVLVGLAGLFSLFFLAIAAFLGIAVVAHALGLQTPADLAEEAERERAAAEAAKMEQLRDLVRAQESGQNASHSSRYGDYDSRGDSREDSRFDAFVDEDDVSASFNQTTYEPSPLRRQPSALVPWSGSETETYGSETETYNSEQ